MPDALEFPGVLGAVVPLMRGQRFAAFFGRSVVNEFVAFALGHALRRGCFFAGRRARLNPGFAAVVGALDDLSEPAAGLRGVDAVRCGRRSFHVVNLPTAEVRAADLPALAFAIGSQHEAALVRADQYSYLAHPQLLFFISLLRQRRGEDFADARKFLMPMTFARPKEAPPLDVWPPSVGMSNEVVPNRHSQE